MRRFKELDFFSKEKFKKENPIDWNETKCVICGLRLPTAASIFLEVKITTYLDFVVAREHAFIINIFDHDEQSKSVVTHEKYHESFRKCCKLSFC